MKVIKCDNYGRDFQPEYLIAEGLTEFEAKRMAGELNANCDPDGPDYYRVVVDGYVLETGDPR